MVTAEDIAVDLCEYLRDNERVCAEGSVRGYQWLRFQDGEWQLVEYSSDSARLNSYVEGRILHESSVVEWITENPVNIIPESDAAGFFGDEDSIWAHADQQGVFRDSDRCFWCGDSEDVTDLTSHQTVEDGECLLCSSCLESWKQADEIIDGVNTVSTHE